MTETAVGTGEERLVGGYAGRMLALLSFASMVSIAGRLVLPAVLPTVIETFGITPAGAGGALTVLIAGIALTQYVGGRAADELSRKAVLAGALGLFILGFAVLALAPTFGAFLVGAAIIGLGQGLYLPASFALLSDLYVARRGQAFGVTNASFALGSALAPALAVAALAVGPWRGAFVPVIALLALALAGLHAWSEEPYALGGVDLELRATAARLVAAPAIRRSLLAFALTGFVWQGAVNFVPTVLQVERGFSPSFAGATFAGLFLVAMVVTPFTGRLGDRLGYPAVAAGGLAVGLLGLGLLVAGPGAPAAVVGVLAFGGGVSSFWPTMNAYVMDRFPEGNAAGDFGALNTVTLAVGGLGPTYVGFVAERAGYPAAFAGIMACAVVAVLALVWVARAPGG